MPPIYSGDCSEVLADHVCNPCPTPEDREFGRVRTAGFIFSDYIDEMMAAPTLLATWETGIIAGKIIVVPETAGEYDPGEPKVLKGYGDRIETYGARTMTLKFNDPNLVANYEHYNGLGNQTELIPFFRTSSQLRIFDKPATITAKDPVADDIESEVTWEVSAKVVSSNIPSYHVTTNLINTVFKCSYLNGITVVTSYDTELTFEAATTDTAAGVGGVVAAIDADLKFSFDAIASPTGTPQSMSIKVGGVEQMTIDFTTDYSTPTAKPFKFTDASGTAHNGVFTNGIVNF